MIGRIIKLAALAAVLAGAYVYFQPQADAVIETVRERWNLMRGDAVAAQEESPAGVSEQTAREAERKIGRLRGESGRESFSGEEMQSLLEYRYRQSLPDYVSSPRITIDGSQIALNVRIPVARLPHAQDLGEILSLLPDTTDLALRGTLIPSDDGWAAYTVDGLTAQRIPLPARLVPALLDMFGREDAPGLPADAIRVPLPEGARTAYVRADSLVVLSTGSR